MREETGALGSQKTPKLFPGLDPDALSVSARCVILHAGMALRPSTFSAGDEVEESAVGRDPRQSLTASEHVYACRLSGSSVPKVLVAHQSC